MSVYRVELRNALTRERDNFVYLLERKGRPAFHAEVGFRMMLKGAGRLWELDEIDKENSARWKYNSLLSAHRGGEVISFYAKEFLRLDSLQDR